MSTINWTVADRDATIVRMPLRIRPGVAVAYPDVLGVDGLAAIEALAPLDEERRAVLAGRTARRARRIAEGRPPRFLDESVLIPRTSIRVADARAGHFRGGEIPPDLRRQWVQGTGPAARPHVPLAQSLRNVAYALLSGADGWMFDGEDALGQVATMSLDNQRSLRLALSRDPLFLSVAEGLAAEMNRWAEGFLGRPLIADWRAQLERTTVIFRARGLHLDDRHLAHADGESLSASIVDTALYVTANAQTLLGRSASVVLYLPKIQSAEEAALWNEILRALETHRGLAPATIRTYVLVEQLEASFQLMEIRAALGPRFVGFNTGRWDYINSVADALAGVPGFVDPNIDQLTMTYPYMAAYEDRVRRAAAMPDVTGRTVLWQGGMEPQIPVGSEQGVRAAMARAVAGAEREQREGASGKWVAHWKMVQVIRPVWERAGQDNQLGRPHPPLTHTSADAQSLLALAPGPRTVRGARDLLSVALQYGNAFGQGLQAAALKPADFFGDDDVLYLMEDMATGEIRLSILWEWLHKGGAFTAGDPETGVRAGDPLTAALLARLVEEEYAKLQRARDRDVHDDSKRTTLPIARLIVEAYVTESAKLPWYVDLLNLCLEVHDPAEAAARIRRYAEQFRADGSRVTRNLDFETAPRAMVVLE